MERLSGKVAIVTGAARGQGAAEARLFVAEGARVLVCDIAEEDGSRLAAPLGDDAIFVRHDVTDAESWRRTVALAVERWGGVDILVNNAGVAGGSSVEHTTIEDYEATVAVNQTGVWLGMRAVVSAMRAQGGGSIVNISSGAGLFGLQTHAIYSATKFAVRGLTKSAALEFADDRIRVNSVHPGYIDTAMSEDGDEVRRRIAQEKQIGGLTIPLGRIGEPEDVANLVLFLASAESSYCTGAEFVVDAGMSAGAMTPVSDGRQR